MPIYEFKCLECDECFELLVMNTKDDVELKCPSCHSENFERILSCTNYNLGSGTGDQQTTSAKTRTCSSGSCTTYEIPGPSG